MDLRKKSQIHEVGLRVLASLTPFFKLALSWLFILCVVRLVETIVSDQTHGLESSFFSILGWGLVNDIVFWLTWLFPVWVGYFLVYIFSARIASVLVKMLMVIFFIIHVILVLYFNTSLVILGADLYSYSKSDIVQTVGASGGVSIVSILALILVIGAVIAISNFIQSRAALPKYLAPAFALLSLLTILLGFPHGKQSPGFDSAFENDLILNKSEHFYIASTSLIFPREIETDIYADSYIGDFDGVKTTALQFEYNAPNDFPFLHTDVAEDVLTPFFNTATSTPNIVILLVEGLGRAYSNEGAYLGSFTPFLDSLSTKSLYWENFLSQGGRTFAVLPSILGSLPFGKNGFLEMGSQMPAQLSMLNILKHNGYKTSFYYSGNSVFDNMSAYLKSNGVEEIRDEGTFPAGYQKLPVTNGFSWGYNDKELFRYYLTKQKPADINQPELNVLLTVSTHNPFVINEANKYQRRFEQRMSELSFSDQQKLNYRKYKDQYASVLYADDAIRGFFAEYSKRADFNRTIFIVTGDHRMPEIPMRTKIDRYHVPLMIYSPMLKRTARISSISTHFDLAPSIIAYLKNSYALEAPSAVTWMGEGLDTMRRFQNLHSVPLMQNKTDLIDFIQGSYHLNGQSVFRINTDMTETPVNEGVESEQIVNAFNHFKKRNVSIAPGKAILPDSLIKKYSRHY